MLQAQIEAVEVVEQTEEQEIVELSLAEMQWIGGGSAAIGLS